MKTELNIDNITEMATQYQKNVYGDLSKLHPSQLGETKQAYLAGFFEGMQFGRQLPPEAVALAEKELKEYFDKRIQELMKLRGIKL